MTVIHCVANGQRKKRFFVAGRHVLPAAKAVKKTQGRVREGRSFAAASGGNRRSGSPMNTEALQAVAQQGDYCELWNRSPFALQSSPAACTAGTGRFLRRKIPFFRAKIASLQFPRPKIRRILAETGRGGSGGEACSPATRGCEKTFGFFHSPIVLLYWRKQVEEALTAPLPLAALRGAPCGGRPGASCRRCV